MKITTIKRIATRRGNQTVIKTIKGLEQFVNEELTVLRSLSEDAEYMPEISSLKFKYFMGLYLNIQSIKFSSENKNTLSSIISATKLLGVLETGQAIDMFDKGCIDFVSVNNDILDNY